MKEVIPLDLWTTILQMVPEPLLVDGEVLVHGQFGHPDPCVNLMKLKDTEVWAGCDDALQYSLLHDNIVDLKDPKSVSMRVCLWRDNNRGFPWKVGRLGIDNWHGFLWDQILVVTREKLHDLVLFAHHL